MGTDDSVGLIVELQPSIVVGPRSVCPQFVCPIRPRWLHQRRRLPAIDDCHQRPSARRNSNPAATFDCNDDRLHQASCINVRHRQQHEQRLSRRRKPIGIQSLTATFYSSARPDRRRRPWTVRPNLLQKQRRLVSIIDAGRISSSSATATKAETHLGCDRSHLRSEI
ncbi:hypothetical protein ACLOJK_003114 [Asimina triloba]